MCAAVFQKIWSDTVELLMREKELVHCDDFNMETTHLHKAFVTLWRIWMHAGSRACRGSLDIFLSFVRTDVLLGKGLVSSYRRARAALLVSTPAVVVLSPVCAPFTAKLAKCTEALNKHPAQVGKPFNDCRLEHSGVENTTSLKKSLLCCHQCIKSSLPILLSKRLM